MEKFVPDEKTQKRIDEAINEEVDFWRDDIDADNVNDLLNGAEIQHDACHFWYGGEEQYVQVVYISDYTQELNDFIHAVYATVIAKLPFVDEDVLEIYVKDDIGEMLYMAFDEEVFGNWSYMVTDVNAYYYQFLTVDDGYIYAVRPLTDEQYRKLTNQEPLDPGQTRMEV